MPEIDIKEEDFSRADKSRLGHHLKSNHMPIDTKTVVVWPVVELESRSHRQSLDPSEDWLIEDGYVALDALDAFCQEAGLSHGELWLRYFELGGMSTTFDLDAFLYGVLAPSDYDHDVIALALNERFIELRGAALVPYVTVRI